MKLATLTEWLRNRGFKFHIFYRHADIIDPDNWIVGHVYFDDGGEYAIVSAVTMRGERVHGRPGSSEFDTVLAALTADPLGVLEFLSRTDAEEAKQK